VTVDALAQWLFNTGTVAFDDCRGLADALMGNFSIHPVDQTEADKLEEAYVEGYDAAIAKVYALLRHEAFSDETRQLMRPANAERRSSNTETPPGYERMTVEEYVRRESAGTLERKNWHVVSDDPDEDANAERDGIPT
jgi:hypothetical protein